MNNQKNQHRRPRPPIQWEEVTIVVGAPRSFRPIVNGIVYMMGVRVLHRTDVRVPLFAYETGWVTFPEAALNEEVSRESMTFVPRHHIGHDDSLETIKLLQQASTRIGVALANAEKERDSVLTHRIVIADKR